MNWKALLKSIGHAAGGAATAATLSVAVPAISAHLDPATGAVIGSALSSIISAFCKQPHVE